jgi:hypothetical protein
MPNSPIINRVVLSQQFASVFSDRKAKSALRRLGAHIQLPTFNLTTTSLRHIKMWFDRIDDINRGHTRPHGNYFSDPAAVGLVNSNVRPRILTIAGREFLAFRPTICNNPLRAEYELLKILYFKGIQHSPNVQDFLDKKGEHLIYMLNQFSPSPARELFLTYPCLLVIAELIASFPGAIPRLLQLPEDILIGFASLGEGGFSGLCSGPGYPNGLSHLCRKIGSDYTRAEERRLYYLVSKMLLTIAASVPRNSTLRLVIPAPFCNLLTEVDIYNFYSQYTSDISIWFDGQQFNVSSSMAIPAIPPVQPVNLQPLNGIPGGRGAAPPEDQRRRRRPSRPPTRVTIIIDQVLSERAEDIVEERILVPQYGQRIVRVGHRNGEAMALPDGMVPGADFYVMGPQDPSEFIEVKSIIGTPPFDVTFTRAEYLRVISCFNNEIPYRLILVDCGAGRLYEVQNFAPSLAAMQLAQTAQFVIRITI